MANSQPDQLPETIHHTLVPVLVSARETNLCRTGNKGVCV